MHQDPINAGIIATPELVMIRIRAGGGAYSQRQRQTLRTCRGRGLAPCRSPWTRAGAGNSKHQRAGRRGSETYRTNRMLAERLINRLPGIPTVIAAQNRGKDTSGGIEAG